MKTQGNMFWEMRPPLPFLLFILCGLLIYGADYVLIDSLGKNPLEGEINLLEKDTRRAEDIQKEAARAKKTAAERNRQKAIEEIAAEEKPVRGGSLLGYAIFSVALLLALGSTFACVVAFEKRRRAELAAARALAPPGTAPAVAAPRKAGRWGVNLRDLVPSLPSFSAAGGFLATRRGIAVLNVILGALMLSFGGLYLYQGKDGMAALKDDMDRIATIYPKDDDRDPWEKRVDRDKEDEYKLDARRHTRGVAFLSVGGLMVVLSSLFFQIAPPAPRRRRPQPGPGRDRAPAGQG